MDKSKTEPEKMELVGVTCVVDAITFWAQNVSEDQAVKKMTTMLSEKCPVAKRLVGNPSPQKIYGALFSEDRCWYRCKVLQQTEDKFKVLYIDYGNTENVGRSAVVELPDDLQTASLGKMYKFWGFHVSSDQESPHFLQGKTFLHNLIYGKKLRIQKKAVCFDGTILVQAFQGDLDIGEEVLKMKFARLSVPGNRDSPHPSRVLQDPSALWPHRVVERGDAEMTTSLGSLPKLRAVLIDQKPQAHKERGTTTALQPANLLKKKMDQELVEENERLKAENSAQQQAALLLERELRDTQAELQRANLAVLKDSKEIEKLKEGNSILQQKKDDLQNQLKETRLALELVQQDARKNAGEVEKLLETAAEARLGNLAERVDLLRKIRESRPSSTVGDSLQQAISIVMNNRTSIPVAMEKLEVAWKEYSHAQETLKACQMREELADLIEQRNKVRCALVAAVDDYIEEVEGLPISERMDMFEHVAASLTAVFGAFSVEDAGDQAFEQFTEWKSRKQQDSQGVMERTEAALQSLCSWFSDAAKFFCLSSKTSVCLSDVAVGLDALLKKVEMDVCKELEVSRTEQKDQDVQIVCAAFNRVMQEIQKEQSLLRNIREKYLQNLQFKEELHQWQCDSPNADRLFLIKKGIRALRTRLRWRLVEEGSLEEAEEQDLTEIMKKKEEIAETRNALFQEISQEKEEYRKLSVLAKGGFPELLLLYPEADIPSYMNSEGLLLKSLDRDVFDAEPMRELSGRRPLLCTEFQGQRVILKGYSVDEETEARMLAEATKYHRAGMLSEERAGLLPLVALFLGKSDPLAYVMVPYFSGGSLKAVQKTCPLTASETVAVMRGVALGLLALHGFAIIHGSLHPGNVFVLNREQGVVGDFDFTKTAEQRAANCGVVGSISLVAPEVRQGQSPSQSCDLYSFGCLLLWLHFPEARFTLKTDGLTPDTSELKMNPKLDSLLSKLLICSGRLTAPEVLSDGYFLEGGV